MKASKSPENTEVTPSKKKLKQARLPFKIISEASPSPVSPVTPPSRKRKLSATEAEIVAKTSKISKENEIVDLVVLSDDDSKDEQTSESNKLPNPYVKLVDAAWKKKLHKAKGGRKKRGSKKSTSISEKVSENGSVINKIDDSDVMDVDEAEIEQQNDAIKPQNNQNKTANTTINKIEVSDIVDLDSNSADVQESSNTPENTQKSESEPNSNDESSNKSENEHSPSPDSESESTTESSHKNEPKTKENNANNSENSSSNNQSQSDTQDLSQNESKSNEINDQSSTNIDNKNTHSDKQSTDKEQIPVTPKRSLRTQSKVEENNNKGSPTSKLNDSTISNPTTPKQRRNSSANKHDESLNESITSNTNLTPKQLQKKAESAKKREEREKERLEREKKKQQEKEERAKQKQEKEEQKKKEREEREEAKRREKEEKEEQRKKEKEEKEKQKDMERKLKEEKEEQKRKEKEEKEEQKRKEKEAREEEKRKKAEALELEKQEQELKKKKAAEAFLNFFVPKQKTETEKQTTVGAVNNNMLSNFTIKSDMRLAPTTRIHLTEDRTTQLERFIKEQNVEEGDLYLTNLRSGVCKPLSSGKTWPLTDKEEDDVILVEDELPPLHGALEAVTCESGVREKLRPKLFSFHENRRPPYWGTWRKKSKFVKPRRPFGQDEKQLDYEVDSDEEWEEEQEGESIDGSAAGSDDEQGPDEYEVDNEVFVPHGYLSDEEATMDEDDVLSLSPEAQKARLKHLEDEFESEMKKPTEKLKPRLYGLFWETKDGGKPENCADAIWNYFGKLSMIMNDPTPFLQPSTDPEDQEKKKVKKKKIPTESEQSPNTEKKKEKRKKVEDKKLVQENKKVSETKKNQPGINMFLSKMKST